MRDIDKKNYWNTESKSLATNYSELNDIKQRILEEILHS